MCSRYLLSSIIIIHFPIYIVSLQLYFNTHYSQEDLHFYPYYKLCLFLYQYFDEFYLISAIEILVAFSLEYFLPIQYQNEFNYKKIKKEK